VVPPPSFQQRSHDTVSLETSASEHNTSFIKIHNIFYMVLFISIISFTGFYYKLNSTVVCHVYRIVLGCDMCIAYTSGILYRHRAYTIVSINITLDIYYLYSSVRRNRVEILKSAYTNYE